MTTPRTLRERAQWCARDREGVRGFRRHPSPIIAGGGTELPSPARGEGTITATEFAARRLAVLVVHLTMSNSAQLLVPVRLRARVSFIFTPPSRGVGGAPRGASSSSSSRLSARVSRAGEARRVRCAWPAKRTLAFRRSTVAFSGRDPAFAGASAGKPAKPLASAHFPSPALPPDPEFPP